MTSSISTALRQVVLQRANGCCEYCLMSLQNLYLRYEIDHVIAEKHGDPTTEDNLSLSCMRCNRNKGSDIASFDWDSKEIVALYNPRLMRWDEHFEHLEGWLKGRTKIGEITIRLLKLNTPDRIDERRVFSLTGDYPCNSQNPVK